MKGGAPQRIGDSGANGIEIIDVDVQGLGFNDVSFGNAEAEWTAVTAARTKNSRLRLQTWSWKPTTGKVTLVSDSGEQPEMISLLRFLNLANTLFVTIVRDNATATDKQPGHLKLITWNIS
jgi:hypothetical protein